MKKFALFGLLFLLIETSFAKIMNGYSAEVQYWKNVLADNIQTINDSDGHILADRRQIKSRIDSATQHIMFSDLTDHLLHQLKIISPSIYREIDKLTDAQGRPVDVFVKLISKDQVMIPFHGVSRFTRTNPSELGPGSEYGKGTVSVTIVMSNKALMVLCHELGHISYIVPHFEEYMIFYKTCYRRGSTETDYIGHAIQDKSGWQALSFERRFRKDLSRYVGVRPESIVARLSRLRRNGGV